MEPTGDSSTRFGLNLEDDSSTVSRTAAACSRQTPNGNVDHIFLTSIVYQRGVLRMQYLGVRFGPEEFRRDLLSLLQE